MVEQIFEIFLVYRQLTCLFLVLTLSIPYYNITAKSNVAHFHYLQGKIRWRESYSDRKISFLQIFHVNLVKNDTCAVCEEQNYHELKSLPWVIIFNDNSNNNNNKNKTRVKVQTNKTKHTIYNIGSWRNLVGVFCLLVLSYTLMHLLKKLIQFLAIKLEETMNFKNRLK